MHRGHRRLLRPRHRSANTATHGVPDPVPGTAAHGVPVPGTAAHGVPVPGTAAHGVPVPGTAADGVPDSIPGTATYGVPLPIPRTRSGRRGFA
ncbi:MAG: hypothetical protein ACRDS0_16920 [Pseudonocardiaceae bacterium]